MAITIARRDKHARERTIRSALIQPMGIVHLVDASSRMKTITPREQCDAPRRSRVKTSRTRNFFSRSEGPLPLLAHEEGREGEGRGRREESRKQKRLEPELNGVDHAIPLTPFNADDAVDRKRERREPSR